VLFLGGTTACNDDENGVILPDQVNDVLTLSVSSNNLILNEKEASLAFEFNWTTGSNYGTGASIEYIFQLDKKGNYFSNVVTINMGKSVYSQSYNYSTLNDLLLSEWSLGYNESGTFESRVIAIVAGDLVAPDTSNVVEINFTTYEPVTTELYIFGSATEVSWDIANAIELEPDNTDPTIFTFTGNLSKGTFKFPVNRNADFGQDMYMRDTTESDSSKMYLHHGGDADDNQWEITNGGKYTITVSLLDLTIVLEKYEGFTLDALYIIGDATEAGWDIANAIELTKNPDNINQFIFDGLLVPGNFKFPLNRDTDWGQDMFMRDITSVDSSKIYLHNGGDADDNQWTITQKGWYRIIVDVSELTIGIENLELYIVGDATSIGWTITSALQLEQDSENPYIFTFNGDLTSGEFKFPVNRNSDWGQDMYMRNPDDATKMYRHTGGASDDNKWTINAEDAGSYILTLNVKDLTINIAKQ
jgi:hypothetical protein